MRRVIGVGFLVSVSLAAVGGAAAPASAADGVPTVRVTKDSANVRSLPGAQGHLMQPAAQGTLLETIDRDGDWFWVILPPDEYGTRRSGWILASDVEVVGQGVGEGEPQAAPHQITDAVAAAKTQEREQQPPKTPAREHARQEHDAVQQQRDAARAAVAQQRDAERRVKKQQEEDARRERIARERNARLERARQRLEQARREFEAAAQSGDAAAAPADPPSTKAQPPKPQK